MQTNETVREVTEVLNISLKNVPELVHEEVLLHTLVNLKTTFMHNPRYKSCKKLQQQVSVLECFIDRLN